MTIASWNVNGLHARLASAGDSIKALLAKCDVVCFQESKMNAERFSRFINDYGRPKFVHERNSLILWRHGERTVPVDLLRLSPEIHTALVENSTATMREDSRFRGRLAAVDTGGFILLNVYSVLDNKEEVRAAFDDLLRKIVAELRKKKPVVVCGDLNVVPDALDGAVNEELRLYDGFTSNARAAFQRLLCECELVDVFRHKHPLERTGTSCGCAVKGKRRREVTDVERAKVAIRLDFFLVDKRLMDGDTDVTMLSDKWGESDHCPIELVVQGQMSTKDTDETVDSRGSIGFTDV